MLGKVEDLPSLDGYNYTARNRYFLYLLWTPLSSPSAGRTGWPTTTTARDEVPSVSWRWASSWWRQGRVSRWISSVSIVYLSEYPCLCEGPLRECGVSPAPGVPRIVWRRLGAVRVPGPVHGHGGPGAGGLRLGRAGLRLHVSPRHGLSCRQRVSHNTWPLGFLLSKPSQNIYILREVNNFHSSL